MKTISLSSKIRVLDRFKGKTKFGFWNNVEPGHILRIECKLTLWNIDYPIIINENTSEIFQCNRSRLLKNYLNFRTSDDNTRIVWETVG